MQSMTDVLRRRRNAALRTQLLGSQRFISGFQALGDGKHVGNETRGNGEPQSPSSFAMTFFRNCRKNGQ